MTNNLKIGLLVVAFLLILIVLIVLRKGRMPIKYSLVWLFPAGIILILAIVPEFFSFFANIFGFQTISNLIVGILFVLLLLVVMALTVLIAGQTTKINLLIQEISLLKTKVKKLENKS